jgi:hypothetical protein
MCRDASVKMPARITAAISLAKQRTKGSFGLGIADFGTKKFGPLIHKAAVPERLKRERFVARKRHLRGYAKQHHLYLSRRA